MLFTAALQRFNMRFSADDAILELGCNESDWLERMAAADPSFRLTGVDIQPRPCDHPAITMLGGNAFDPALFPAEQFRWVVILGALEHFGLGYYGDPVDPAGDRKTLKNVGQWLLPGGFCYLDVPCQPVFEQNRHFRSYAPSDLDALIKGTGLREINRAYSLPEPHAGTWCHEPTERLTPYWFAALLLQRPFSDD